MKQEQEEAAAGKREQEDEGPASPDLDRTGHTAAQRAVLEAAFARESLPNEQQKKAIGLQTGLSQRQVRNWFQNRRMRNKSRAESRQSKILKAQHTKLKQAVDAVRGANGALAVENRLLQSECRKALAHLQDLQDAVERLLPAYYDVKITAREAQQTSRERKRDRPQSSPPEASPAPPAGRGRAKRAKRAAG